MTVLPERQALRRRVLIGAMIREHADAAAIDCRIIDFSLFGARLRLSALVPLPPAFLLDVRRESYACERRWRRGDLVGVRFILSEAQLSDFTLRELQAARDEHAMLTERVTRLTQKLANIGYVEEDEF